MKWILRWKADNESYYKSFPINKLTDKFKFSFKIRKKKLIAFKHKNDILVYDNECPHRNLPLGNAYFENSLIVCNHHNWKFKIETGQCIDTNNYDLIKYPIKIYKDHVWVKF